MAIALSPGGSSIYSSPSRSNQVLVGTKGGVAILERDSNGPGWYVAHQGLTDKHVSSIIFEQESGLVFAGCFHGSVYGSADGGRTWERRDNGLNEDNVYSLASIRRNGGVRVYAGTEPAHLFTSDDLGLHWTESMALRSVPSVPHWTFPAPPHQAHVKHINFAPDDPATIYACIEVGALLRSRDFGETWEDLHTLFDTGGESEAHRLHAEHHRVHLEHTQGEGTEGGDTHRTVIHRSNPNRIYAVSGYGMYVSSDGGKTFERWTDRKSELGGYPDGLVFVPSQPELMFIAAAETSPGDWRETRTAGARISRSRDNGRTWEVLRGGLPDRFKGNIEALSLEEWGDGFSVYAANTSGEVFCSENGGDSWSRIASGLSPVSKGNHYIPLSVAV